MAEMLYSKILKLNDEELEKIKDYCQDHELMITVNTRDRSDFRYWIVVWGTKKQLNEFNEWF